jgi:hypothetical protein
MMLNPIKGNHHGQQCNAHSAETFAQLRHPVISLTWQTEAGRMQHQAFRLMNNQSFNRSGNLADYMSGDLPSSK